MWDLHHKCNYHCSYCSPGLNNGSIDFLKMNFMKGFIDAIINHYVKRLNYKNILFSFTGGEPTLWKDFQELLLYANEKGIRFGLTTNGSVGKTFWDRTAPYFDYICLSFHPEYADVDKFISTFACLHDNKNSVIPSVRLMMHKEKKYWDKSIEVLEKIKQFSNWTYECVYILDNYASMDIGKSPYPQKEMEDFLQENAFKFQFKDNSLVKLPEVMFDYRITFGDGSNEKLDENKLINNEQVDFFGWSCNIGLESLFVDANGEVFLSGCVPGRMYGSIGNVCDFSKIKFPETPIICNTRAGCFCPTDIRIPKKRLY